MMKNDLISRSALADYLKKTKIDEVFPNWKELGCVAKTAVIRLTKQYRVIVLNAPAVDAVEAGSCDGCHWKEIGRQQKCSCCRRNRYLKDCYEGSV